MKQRVSFAAGSFGVFAAVILIWQLVIVAFHVPAYLLPGPYVVAATIVERFPDLLHAVLITAEAGGGGFLGSIVAGTLIALIFARSAWIRRLLYPYTILLQTVPIVAITPLIITWIGPGMEAVMLASFIICLPPIIANATQGLISVDQNLVQLFLMHNATQGQILRKLRLPHSLPYLFVGMRISAGIAVIGGITGELFAGSTTVGGGGVGYSILYAQAQMQTAYLFALVIAATALGFSFFFIVTFFEWLFLHHWHESATPERAE